MVAPTVVTSRLPDSGSLSAAIAAGGGRQSARVKPIKTPTNRVAFRPMACLD